MPSLEDQIRRGQYEDIYRSRVASGARAPHGMQPEELVAEINSLRETMHLAAQRMVDLSRTLYTQTRRSASSDTITTAYIAYANAWGRLAGSFQQGLRRTMVANRVLDRAVDAERREAKPPPKPRAVPERKSPQPNHNPFQSTGGDSLIDLMDLYGREIVQGAIRR